MLRPDRVEGLYQAVLGRIVHVTHITEKEDQKIMEAILSLNQSESRLIALRFGLNTNPREPKEIMVEFGISDQMYYQILALAVQDIREKLPSLQYIQFFS